MPNSKQQRTSVGTSSAFNIIKREHFLADLPSTEKKRIFLNSIASVFIEISRECNRTCVFCPNNDAVRIPINSSVRYKLKKENKELDRILKYDRGLYKKQLSELGRIGYKGNFGFHLFNEPLLDVPYFLECLELARQQLPYAKLTLNTNGDFLNLDTIKELEQLGLNYLHISIYGGSNGGQFDEQKICRLVTEKANSLCLKKTQLLKAKHSIHCSSALGSLFIKILAQNFNMLGIGYNRGGLIQSLSSYCRNGYCPSPFNQILIDYNGNMLPCCNIHTSLKKYKNYVMGNIQNNSIVEIYFSAKAIEWRRACISTPPSKKICLNCARLDSEPSDEYSKYILSVL